MLPEHCLDLVRSGKSLQALTALGQRAQILLSKIDKCYDEKKRGWDQERLKALEYHLEENRVLLRMAQSEVFRDGSANRWMPIRGEHSPKNMRLEVAIFKLPRLHFYR